MQRAKTKKKTSIAWSKNEVKLLKRLYPRGKASEIAKRTGRSLAAVKQKAHRMGISARRMDDLPSKRIIGPYFQKQNARVALMAKQPGPIPSESVQAPN